MPFTDGRLPERRLRIAGFCFFLSGVAALIYQIVWMRQLSVVIGSAQSAIAIILACYMTGLALGGLIGARWTMAERVSVRRYALLELTIALWALGVPFLLQSLPSVMVSLLGTGDFLPADAGPGQTLFFGAAGLIVFGLPTLCMGATLPIMIRALPGTNNAERISLLYSLNTVGAAIGAFAAGFWLIPTLGLTGTTLAATGFNLLAAALVWRFLKDTQETGSARPKTRDPTGSAQFSRMALAAAMTGAATFTLEIFWSRLLAHLIGGTTRGFALMLAIWLAGIAIGGGLAGRVGGEADRARQVCGWMLGSAAMFALGGYLLLAASGTVSIPLAMAALLPGTICLGATFPLFVQAGAGGKHNPGRVAGVILAANTFGAVLGSLLSGYVLIERLGFTGTILLATGILSLVRLVVEPVTLGRAVPLAAICALAVTGLPRPQAIVDNSIVDRAAPGDELFFAVGRTASIQVQDRSDGFAIRSDGLPEALVARTGSVPVFNDQMWLTALPAIARPKARSMLVIGFGGGVALETVPGWIGGIDVVEIESRVIDANRRIAGLRDRNPLADPRIHLVLNDARNALTLANKHYDIIVSQPSHPWTAGSANLYTKEFIALAKSRLTKGGVLVEWMNASFANQDLLDAFVKTVSSQFRHIRIFEPVQGTLIFLASDAPVDPANRFDDMLAQSTPEDRNLLARAGLFSRADLVWPLIADDVRVASIAHGKKPITDDRNRMAYESRATSSGPRENKRPTFGGVAPLAHIPISPHDAAYIAMRLEQNGLGEDAERFKSASRMEDRVFARFSASGVADLKQVPANSSVAAVISGWRAGAQGQWTALAALDPLLARSIPTDPWFSTSAKLRADWRLDRLAGDTTDMAQRLALAREALAIVDLGLQVAPSRDLLIQRATLAQVLGDKQRLTETALAFAESVGSSATPPTALDIRRSALLQSALEQLPPDRAILRAIAALRKTGN